MTESESVSTTNPDSTDWRPPYADQRNSNRLATSVAYRDEATKKSDWSIPATNRRAIIDGTIYTLADYSSTELIAVDLETGDRIQTYELSVYADMFAVTAERIYVGNSPDGLSSNTWRLFALDLETGDEIWNFSFENGVQRGGGLTITNDRIVMTGGADLRVFTLTGEQVWSTSFSRSLSPPAVSNGTVYLTSVEPEGTGGDAAAFELSSGDESWNRTYQDDLEPPIVGGQYVYLLTSDEQGEIEAVSRSDGSTQWSVNPDSANQFSGAALLEDKLIAHAKSGNVLAINRQDGTKEWSSNAPGRSARSVAASNQTLFVSNQYGDLTALRADTGETLWSKSIEQAGKISLSESVLLHNTDAYTAQEATPTTATTAPSTTEPATESTIRRTTTTRVTTTASPTYNLADAGVQTDIILGDRSLKVLYAIPDAGIDRFAVTTPSYELVDTDTARDALLTHWWGERNLPFDWDAELAYAREMRDTYRVTEILNRAASFGWEALEAYALAQVSPAAALGSVLDLLEESIAWAVSEITTPYQEAMSKMGHWQLSYTELRENIREAASLKDLSTDALGFLDVALALDHVWDGWSAALTAGRTAYASSGSMTTALSAAGRGAAASGIYYAALGLVADTAVDTITTGMKQNAELAAIGHGYNVARIPMIERINTLQARATAYELSPGGAWELAYLTANHHFMSAVANHGMYKHAHALDTSQVGFAWDGLTGVGDAATVLEDRAHTYRRGGIAAHRDLGTGYKVASDRAANSINRERLGSPTALGGENL